KTGYLVLDTARNKIYILYTNNITRIDIPTFTQDGVLQLPRSKDVKVCPSSSASQAQIDGSALIFNGERLLLTNKRSTIVNSTTLSLIIGCTSRRLASPCVDTPLIVSINLDSFPLAGNPVPLPQYSPSYGVVLWGPDPIEALINNQYAL